MQVEKRATEVSLEQIHSFFLNAFQKMYDKSSCEYFETINILTTWNTIQLTILFNIPFHLKSISFLYKRHVS